MRTVALEDELAIGGRRSARWLVLPIRRLLYRMLRPVYVRLSAQIGDLEIGQREVVNRLGGQSQQIDSLVNLGWDQAALLRRLAILEQQVEDLMARVVTTQSAQIESSVPSYMSDETGSAVE